MGGMAAFMCLNAESVGKKNDALANLSPDEMHWIPEASKYNFRCSTFTITLYQEFILQPVEMEREGLTAQLKGCSLVLLLKQSFP